jgi:hypothetical protein
MCKQGGTPESRQQRTMDAFGFFLPPKKEKSMIVNKHPSRFEGVHTGRNEDLNHSVAYMFEKRKPFFLKKKPAPLDNHHAGVPLPRQFLRRACRCRGTNTVLTWFTTPPISSAGTPRRRS